ncbi:MAG: tetratricopeptide repeat protein [Proteobacteria bacterium]|nr:tetratricopeptide repeat protein [Pseudomonadota bacterium]
MTSDSAIKRYLLFPLMVLIILGCSSPSYIDQNRQLVLEGRSDQAIKNYTLLIEENQNNADLHYQLADLLYHQHQYTRALISVNRSIELKPSVAKYRKLAGKIFIGLEQFYNATNLLSGSLTLAGNDHETHFFLAKAYIGLSKNGEALTHLKRSLVLSPEYFEARLLLIKLEFMTAKKGSNLDQLIADLDKTLNTSPPSIEGVLLLAQLYQVNGNSFRAKETLQQWHAQQDWNESILYELAYLHSIRHEWEEVIKLLETEKIKLFRTQALLLRAKYYYQTTDSTLNAYKSFLQTEPQSTESLINRAELMVDQGNLGPAERIYQRSIASSTKELRAYQGLVRIRSLQGDNSGALETINTALGLAPLDPILQNQYMNLLFENDEWNELENYFNTLIFNKNSVDHLYFKGLILKQKGSYKSANSMLTNAALLETNPKVEIQLADLAIKEKRYADATDRLQKLERKTPGLLQIKLIKAKLFILSGQKESSIRILEPYLNKKVKNGKLHLLLADSYLLNGETEKALQVLEKGLRFWSFHLSLVDRYTLLLGSLERYPQAIEILQKMKKVPPEYARVYQNRLALFYLQSGEQAQLNELVLMFYQ